MNSIRRWRSGFVIVLTLALTACQGDRNFLNPQGEGAIHIANLWWIMLAIAAVIYVEVLLFTSMALFRGRRKHNGNSSEVNLNDLPPDLTPPSRASNRFIVINGIAIPAIILSIVFGLNLNTLTALAPGNVEPALTIEVIGHRFWWEVRYPHHEVVTANEIHIPTGARVELRLSSQDVIHSLWIPELNGKADLIPGQTNRMYLYTDRAGEYDAACAELCGVQHAFMLLHVVAQPPDEFDAWIAQQQQPAPQPADEIALRGQQIFLGSACVYCHAIEGTSASGVIGPNLTHLASRKSLGAGVVPNTRGNLAGWLIDSQGIKPGNEMPPIYLQGDDLQALLTYLETLQ